MPTMLVDPPMSGGTAGVVVAPTGSGISVPQTPAVRWDSGTRREKKEKIQVAQPTLQRKRQTLPHRGVPPVPPMIRARSFLVVGGLWWSFVVVETRAWTLAGGSGAAHRKRAAPLRSSAGDDSKLPEGWVRTTDGVQVFDGAGGPRPGLRPEEVPALLMTALSQNDTPHANAGLESMWAFAGGATQHVFGHNVTEFVESAHQTANEFPTSFYGVAFYGQHWEIESEINRVGGEDGWIATQVMKTVTSDGRVRRWQWELRKNQRPPCLGCWKVETIASSDRKGNFEPE